MCDVGVCKFKIYTDIRNNITPYVMSKKQFKIQTNYVVDGKELQQYASIKCEKPQFVTTRSGIRIAVPCGQCIACLRKRRNSWSIPYLR